jgi:hypothetical protein
MVVFIKIKKYLELFNAKMFICQRCVLVRHADRRCKVKRSIEGKHLISGNQSSSLNMQLSNDLYHSFYE